ncbi:helix-hairpin-helix domain-containing protein [Arcanobacterium hippocoleae]
MKHPPPNRNSQGTMRYFQQAALSAALGDETHLHSQTLKRARIGLDKNALISLAVIFLVVLISVLIVGIYNSEFSAKALPAGETSNTETKNNENVNGIESDNALPEMKSDSGNTESAKIIVYVSGAVKQPGVVEIAGKSRINDAVKAAGGPTEEADLAHVNLAQIVNDGEQIYVPKLAETKAANLVPGIQGQNNGGGGGAEKYSESGADPGTAATVSKVNLNTATLAQLDQIPGVGPVTAKEILAWREENGSFKSIEDLLQISGIGEKTLEKFESTSPFNMDGMR